MKNRFTATVIAALLVGCAGDTSQSTPDDYLYYEVFMDDSASGKTMVVFLHGDSGRDGVPGRASRYMFHQARKFADRYQGEAIGVGMLRPGYRDRDGNRSPGTPSQIDDDKTPRKNAEVARSVAHLKELYDAENVIGVGHSGGAAMLGSIIGQRPDLFDAVVLVSVACDIPRSRRHRSGRNRWVLSQSPKDFVDTVSPDIVIRAISGENDNNVLSHHATDCVKAYQDRGINAEAIIVAGAGHTRGLLPVMQRELDKLLQEGML
ncbi:MAG: alpha/beta hydrolase family protein [bacterium]